MLARREGVISEGGRGVVVKNSGYVIIGGESLVDKDDKLLFSRFPFPSEFEYVILSPSSSSSSSFIGSRSNFWICVSLSPLLLRNSVFFSTLERRTSSCLKNFRA